MFWDEVKKHYTAGSAHQFLLHFNVNDLLYDDVYGYLPAVDYFMEQLNVLGCDLVLGYNTSQGIQLPNVGRWRNTQRMLQLLPKEASEKQRESARCRLFHGAAQCIRV